MESEVSRTKPDPAKGEKEHGKGKQWSWASRRRELERDLAHVNREIYGRNLELAQTNKTLALLQAIDSLVLDPANSLRPLCAKLAREISAAGYPFVAILGHPREDHGDLEVFGWAAADEVTPKNGVEFLGNLNLPGDSDWLKSNEPLKLINLDKLSDAEIAHYCKCPITAVHEAKKTLGLHTIWCIKLWARQGLVGVMGIGFTDQGHNDLNEFARSLFVRLGEAVGIAIDHKMLLEENQHILAQLKRSNEKLKALDRAKDDFISMASHQLRTPLTSVKGYVSMVLDGDAGKISQLQRRLLNQSFVSSQRMVYLVSDLLNVSRLKTGNFVIEPVRCNLAKVVQEEVEQLMETAKGRRLQLTYQKPEQFPIFMLDETKLRQVIMNFLDNAVYYTPAGGHIEVHLVEKPQTIEFAVVDDGIGVPRLEQRHLFTKFYRAPNARRARPDGTGLGLFMAKKVIIAQGGAVIFKSQEGKGSMFGFTFAKSRLTLAAGGNKNEQK